MKPNSLMTPTELAEYLRIPLGTLYQWRHRGEGPEAIRVGRHLRYRHADVTKWEERQKKATTIPTRTKAKRRPAVPPARPGA